METVPAGFASIYLPYIWIPASAGMTKHLVVWWAQPNALLLSVC